MRAFSLLLTFSLGFPSSNLAQQAPNATLSSVPPFSNNSTGLFRQHWCDEYRAVWEGRSPLADALQGAHINVVLAESGFDNFDEQEQRLDPAYPGLTPELLDEICKRAGCTWRNTYARVPVPPPGKTWTEMLLWMTDTYDISANWWASSIDRLKAGATFLESWYDGSIIMVGKVDQEDSAKFSAWGWLEPFDYWVWFFVCVTVVCSAAVYWMLDRLDPNADETEGTLDPMEVTWMFATAFTGQFEFEPASNAARLFTFSISMWALLMTAAYTANLASFLVVKNTPKLSFSSLDEAVKLGIPMCIRRSSGADVAVSKVYPNANILRKDTVGMWEAVNSGECTVAITTVSGWDSYQNDASVNGLCDLQWIGRVFQHVPASFATKADSGEKCTSLLRDVFNVHMMEMQLDGFIDASWEKYNQQTATVFCTDEGEEEEFTDTSKLTIQNMGGVFLLHAILSGSSILLAVGVWVYRRRVRQQGGNANEVGVAGSTEDEFDHDLKLQQESRKETQNTAEPPIHSSSVVLTGSIGRDFEVENLRMEMNRKLDKLLRMMEDEKKNA